MTGESLVYWNIGVWNIYPRKYIYSKHAVYPYAKHTPTYTIHQREPNRTFQLPCGMTEVREPEGREKSGEIFRTSVLILAKRHQEPARTSTVIDIPRAGISEKFPVVIPPKPRYTYVNVYIRKFSEREKGRKMGAELSKYYDLTAIDRADLGEKTRAQYQKALRNCLAAGVNITDAGALAEYAAALPRSSRAFLKAAIRLVTADLANNIRANVTPETLPAAQAALMRLESMNQTIKVKAAKGEKAHTWLSQAQVKALMATCDDTLTGRRDWVVLALLVGAGLRREELAGVTCADLVDVPGKKGARWLLQVKGKGAKNRVIPISATLAQRLRDWCEFIGQGQVARSLGMKKELGETLSEIGIFGIVRKHGAAIGKPDLDPHDLRRTYAQLGYEAGVPVTQISKLLGHADIATTQRYLNLDLDLETTVSDFIPLE